MSHEQSQIQKFYLRETNWQKNIRQINLINLPVVEHAGVSDPGISSYWPLKWIAEVHDL
jgi:hypothetical protein